MADFLGMMKQAAELQSKMQAMQEELGNVEVEGISGGGLVTVRMTSSIYPTNRVHSTELLDSLHKLLPACSCGAASCGLPVLACAAESR